MIDKNLFQIPKMRRVLLGLAVISLLQAFFIIGQAYYLARAITGLWYGGRLKEQVIYIVIFALCFIARHIILLMRDKWLMHYAHEQVTELRVAFLDKVFALGPNFVQKNGTGHMVSLSIEGMHQIENYFVLILPKIVNMMVIPWVIVAFIWTQDHRSAWIVFFVFPVIIIFMILLGYAAKAKADRQYEGFQRLGNHFLDVLRGLPTLRVLGLTKRYERNVFEVSEQYRKATMSTLKIAILSTFALDFFTTLSVAVVALFLGLKLMAGTLVLLPALTVLILVPDFFLPIRDFSNDYHATLDGGNTLKDLFSVLNQPNTTAPFSIDIPRWHQDSTLMIHHMSVSYDQKTPVLQHLNFSWQGYGKIGVIGMSGSGKSTLIKTLGGFLAPDQESIEIEKHSVRHLNLPKWQEQLAYLPQDPYLFHDTLRDNIAFYTPEATDEEILTAIQHAGLDMWLSELPEGLDTMIGEGAQSVSGGQAQRIALARIFLDQHRRILLFDEPTAHLDIETEADLKETMLPLFEGRLVFFATHRLHWMKEMDYILVMDQGMIVEQGTYEDLSSDPNSAYSQLVNAMGGNIL